jgi:ferredoxin
VKQDRSLCIRCGKCVQACPIAAIVQDELDNPYVCIHCGRCVPYCPHDCLELAEKGQANVIQEVAE